MFDINTAFNIFICICSVPLLLLVLRHDRMSLGLPMAYLLLLLLNHVPGAYAYLASGGTYGAYGVSRGFGLTTIGVVAFVIGVAIPQILGPDLARRRGRKPVSSARSHLIWSSPAVQAENGPLLWIFCLAAGFGVTFGFNLFVHIASLGALIQQGGAIWMLGVMLGLADAIHRQRFGRALFWGAALAVYPAVILVLGGFLSFGTTTVVIVGAALAVLARPFWKPLGIIATVAVIGVNIFVNYFEARTNIRNAVWGGASLERRMDVILGAAEQAHIFSTKNPDDLNALDLRLNQNYFIGVAAARLDSGDVGYLHGRSILDGVYGLIPRALWASKPVSAGSGNLVRDFTGLDLNLNTSWGVGQVMEFYINFALPGLIIGFIALGMLLGWLDRKAAEALQFDVRGTVFLFFLPGAAMTQPISSLVDFSTAAAASLVAAVVWKYAWRAYRQGVYRKRARINLARQGTR